MKTYYSLHKISGKQKEINLIHPDFVEPNKKRCRIIYDNKLYPLQSKILIKRKRKSKIKIRLICYRNILDKFHNLENYDWDEEIKMKEIDCVKDLKMVYKNIKSKIKIFGEKFVKNNKHKCVILYKDKIFKLQEYLKLKNIKANEKEVEIFLLKKENINDRSFMFHGCYSLLKLENEIMESKTEGEKEFNSQNTNLSNPIYSKCRKNDISEIQKNSSNSITTNTFKSFKNALKKLI